MLINLFQITFFNHYVLSPKTWIHKIPSNIKILLKFIYLILVPYIHHKYIAISAIIYIIVLINLPIPKSYILSRQQMICIFLVYIINVYLYTTNIFMDTIYNTVNSRQVICNLLSFNYYLYNQCNKTCMIIQIIPKYIARGISIYIVYFILLKIIYLTTQYENIIQCYLVTYKQNINRLYTYKLFILICSSFIVFLINEIETVIHAAIIRNSSYRCVYYYALKHFLCNILSNTVRISSILHYRKIFYWSIH